MSTLGRPFLRHCCQRSFEITFAPNDPIRRRIIAPRALIQLIPLECDLARLTETLAFFVAGLSPPLLSAICEKSSFSSIHS